MNHSLVKIIKFCTEAEIKQTPKTKEEWQLCQKSYGEEYKNLPLYDFISIHETLNTHAIITNKIATPLALFYNLKNKIVKTK